MLGTIKIYDSSSLSLIKSFQSRIIYTIKQSPFYNPNYVATSSDYVIEIWSAFNWTLIRTLKHSSIHYALEWLDQDTLASCGYDEQTITIWSISTGENKRNITFINKAYSIVFRLKPLSNKIHLAVSVNFGVINIFNINDGSLVSLLIGHTWTVIELIQINNSELLASSSFDQTVRIWNLTTNTCKFILRGHTSPVYGLKEINSEVLASSSANGPIKMWNITSGALIRNLESRWPLHLDLIKERQQQASTLVSASSFETIIKVWNWTNGECLKTVKIDGSYFTSLAVINPVSNAYYQTGLISFSFLLKYNLS
jgi:WD40 repeat protein